MWEEVERSWEGKIIIRIYCTKKSISIIKKILPLYSVRNLESQTDFPYYANILIVFYNHFLLYILVVYIYGSLCYLRIFSCKSHCTLNIFHPNTPISFSSCALPLVPFVPRNNFLLLTCHVYVCHIHI